MIDYITKQRVTVELDENSCPVIEISNYSDMDQLDDILSEKFHLIYIYSTTTRLRKHGGERFHFSSLVDREELQKVLDSIDLNE
ncbi:hypothetical protein A1OO_19340 [Enterovibrio norvegicus FF-33]|uniref:Uncharacterized protein n=1 Tax=Enterovibrio norvegicus FF-454 TaxID=1185651 RepID=A0A1E5C0B9_9GAMM|nr:hypothetical protein [Enterovibrio norvegicus]OEE58953.1 hypothetical protein A1OK_02800 [Enterovibrio norvegicus FF-454]OEE67893.1 hypothetical protein A1OO_19340 [Enterovibrio norvegicus FF-33]OEE73971.1 hypothetical protein A1OQ_10160 [Enterovibrio norvegicus FF-162]